MKSVYLFFLLFSIISCQTTVKKINFAVKGYEVNLNKDEKKRIIDNFSKLGYYFPKQAILVSYVSEAKKPEKISIETFNGTSSRYQSDFYVHHQTQVFISSEMKKTVLLCQEKYYLSSIDHDFNKLFIFGFAASNQQVIKKFTEISFFSDIFITEKNPSLEESLDKCQKENDLHLSKKADDFYKVFASNVLYPVQKKICTKVSSVGQSPDCQQWFEDFHPTIKSKAAPYCITNDTGKGFCELRSKLESVSVAFNKTQNEFDKLSLNEHSSIVQTKEVRFICYEKNDHFYLAKAFNYDKDEDARFLCLLRP